LPLLLLMNVDVLRMQHAYLLAAQHMPAVLGYCAMCSGCTQKLLCTLKLLVGGTYCFAWLCCCSHCCCLGSGPCYLGLFRLSNGHPSFDVGIDSTFSWQRRTVLLVCSGFSCTAVNMCHEHERPMASSSRASPVTQLMSMGCLFVADCSYCGSSASAAVTRSCGSATLRLRTCTKVPGSATCATQILERAR
jgi:hypothetical protein